MNKDEIIRSVEHEFIKNDIPDFSPGDVIRVYEWVTPLGQKSSGSGASSKGEGGRTQVFEGVVLKRSGGGTSEMFTVRKDSFGIGIEKVFPLHSPNLEKIELVKKGSVRQARPYYLRKKTKRKPKRRTLALDEEMRASSKAKVSDHAPEVSEEEDKEDNSNG